MFVLLFLKESLASYDFWVWNTFPVLCLASVPLSFRHHMKLFLFSSGIWQLLE